MKVKVIKPFLDKFDHSVSYTVGSVLDWDDDARIADCVERGLIETIKEEAEKPKSQRKPAAKRSQ